jgi:glycerol transport system permease protein
MSKRKTLALLLYFLFLLVPIYWLLNMSFKSNTEILGGLTLWPQDSPSQLRVIFTDQLVHRLHQLAVLRGLNTVISLTVACRRPMPSRATASSATSTCSSGC